MRLFRTRRWLLKAGSFSLLFSIFNIGLLSVFKKGPLNSLFGKNKIDDQNQGFSSMREHAYADQDPVRLELYCRFPNHLPLKEFERVWAQCEDKDYFVKLNSRFLNHGQMVNRQEYYTETYYKWSYTFRSYADLKEWAEKAEKAPKMNRRMIRQAGLNFDYEIHLASS